MISDPLVMNFGGTDFAFWIHFGFSFDFRVATLDEMFVLRFKFVPETNDFDDSSHQILANRFEDEFPGLKEQIFEEVRRFLKLEAFQ